MDTLLAGVDQIKKVIVMKEAVEVAEAVFRGHGEGTVVMPPKINLKMGENGEWPHYWGSSNSMPAYVDSLEAMGVKFASGYKKNPEKGLPFILATIILCAKDTGYPIAVMDGTYITAVRTGAASAVAAKYLAKKNPKTLGIIGAGTQARMNIRALHEVFDFEEVKITDVNNAYALEFAVEMNKELGIYVKAVDSSRHAVEGSDIIVTVTVADEPLVMKEWLDPGALVLSLGSYQELDENIPLKADKLVVDNWEQNTHRGELVKLINAGKLDRSMLYGELGEIVAGKKAGRENDREIICACLIGIGSLDIGTAKYVYDKLKDKDDITRFKFY